MLAIKIVAQLARLVGTVTTTGKNHVLNRIFLAKNALLANMAKPMERPIKPMVAAIVQLENIWTKKDKLTLPFVKIVKRVLSAIQRAMLLNPIVQVAHQANMVLYLVLLVLKVVVRIATMGNIR
jgi:hypothetical protein